MLDWQPFAIAGGVAAFLIAFPKVRRGVREVWEVTALIVTRGRRLAQMHRTLLEIAAEFAPNHGTSLFDRITVLERSQERQQDTLDQILNRIDTHIAQRQPGGQRSSDPE